jgi:hypothetical protein
VLLHSELHHLGLVADIAKEPVHAIYKPMTLSHEDAQDTNTDVCHGSDCAYRPALGC